MYYSATLFKSIGFNQPTAVGLIIAGTNFLFTLIALKYIDIVGRRRIMIWTSPGMIFGLTLASVSFHCTSYARQTVNESVILITLIFYGSLNEKYRQRPCGRCKLF